MYEVGSWYIYLLDGAILAIIGMVLMVVVIFKRGKYQKEAEQCIRCEIHLPTGWSEYYVVPCDISAKCVTVKDFIYTIDPHQRRYGKHPLNPFLGLGMLQVPVRIESWYQDNPEPMRQSYETTIATAAEIKAITREVSATTAAMQIQEIEARQNELVKAISNQPNKAVVYILLIIAIIASVVGAIISYQSG
jgi:hypothetical protein